MFYNIKKVIIVGIFIVFIYLKKINMIRVIKLVLKFFKRIVDANISMVYYWFLPKESLEYIKNKKKLD